MSGKTCFKGRFAATSGRRKMAAWSSAKTGVIPRRRS